MTISKLTKTQREVLALAEQCGCIHWGGGIDRNRVRGYRATGSMVSIKVHPNTVTILVRSGHLLRVVNPANPLLVSYVATKTESDR